MKASTYKKTLTGVASAAAVLVAAVAVTVAHGGSNRAPAATTTAAANAPASSASLGLKVARDPETGALRQPTAEEMLQLQAPQAPTAKSAKLPPLKQERLANGAYVTTLDSSFEMASVAVKGADGKIVTACVTADRVQATLDAAQQQSQTLATKEVLDEK